LIQRREAWSPLLVVPNVTASVPITVLLYDGPLLYGFNVAIKGLKPQSYDIRAAMDTSSHVDTSLFVKTAATINTKNNTVTGTLAVDGWAVTSGTARRGLGGLRPRPVPSSLYQM